MLLLAATVLLLGVSRETVAAKTEPPADAPTNAKMVFDDEFNTLDLSRYSTKYWWGERWLGGENAEHEVYADQTYAGSANGPLGLNPFSLVNGMLQIQATIPARSVAPYLEGQKYVSGLLTTYRSFSQLYGYFEIRARFPLGKGYWPAFWMLPKVSMPNPPEIDVVEVLGDQPTALNITAHWNVESKAKKQEWTLTVPDTSEDFHRYGVLWTHDVIAWYFDGKRVAVMATPDDLNRPMYMLLNLAVGGSWPGYPNARTKFPGNMLVGYIRVYSAD
jgi:beta-glucanase (GH16 family)